MSLTSFKVSDIPLKKELVTFTNGEDIEKAFAKLFESRILSAPVLDKDGKVTGILAMIDIAVFAVNLAKTSQALVAMLGLPVERPELLMNFDNLPDLFTGDKRLEDAFGTDATEFMKNFSRRNPTKSVSYAGSWHDLVEALTQVRRVVVLDGQHKLVNYITQSDMIKLLHQRGLFGAKEGKTVSELNLGTSPVISVKDDQRVLEAFKLFALHEIEAVPVLSASTGDIVGNISATDIRVVKASVEAIDSLYLTYDDFRKRMDEYNVPSKPVTVTSSSTLGEVISLMLQNKIHRVYVVEGTTLKAVISMTDILKTLIH